MRASDAIRLSLKKFKLRPKSNFYIILSICIIFYLIFVLNFLFAGFRSEYLSLSSKGTNGKVILNVFPSEDEASINTAIEDVKSFNGSVLGKTKYYDNYTGVIIPEDLIAPLITEGTFLKGGVPILASTFLGEEFLDLKFSNGIENYERYRNLVLNKTFENNGTKYTVVGLAPGSFYAQNFSLKNLDRRNENIFSFILEHVPTSSAPSIVVDNNKLDQGKIVEYEQITVVFDDINNAYNYLRNGSANFGHTNFPGRYFIASYIAGPDPDVLYVIDSYSSIKDAICIGLGVSAVIIIFFSLIRFLDFDKKNITLYRTVGASKSDLCLIYGSYFAEIIILAIITACLIALASVYALFAINQETIHNLFEIALSLS